MFALLSMMSFGVNMVLGKISLTRLDPLIFCLFFFMFSIGANVNILAHFGGLVAGIAAGFLKPKFNAE